MYTFLHNQLVSLYVYHLVQAIIRLVCIPSCTTSYWACMCPNLCSQTLFAWVASLVTSQSSCVYHLVQKIGVLACMPSCATSQWACMYYSLYNKSVGLYIYHVEQQASGLVYVPPWANNHWNYMYTTLCNQSVGLHAHHLVEQICYCNIHWDLAQSAGMRLFFHVFFQTTGF